MKKFLIILLIFLLSSVCWSGPPSPIPPIRTIDCTSFIVDGVMCYDTDNDKFYIGNGTSAIEQANIGNTIFPNAGVPVYDSNSSHALYLKTDSNLTANHNLTFATGDSDRTITLNGNPTLNDWFDQAVKAASAVTFATVDTGQGANELYDMDQNVLIASSPTFAGLTITGLSGIVLASIGILGAATAGTDYLAPTVALKLPTVTKVNTDSPYTVLSSDFSIICNAASGAIIVNLPAATGTGRIIEIKKIDSSVNLVTPTGNGAELIDGSNTITLTAQWEAVTLQDTASGVWHIL
jgi:hypothetical protein